MVTYANAKPNALTDGFVYADAVQLTNTEADLYNGPTGLTLDPMSVKYGEAVVAVVQLTVTGNPAGNSTYVVMQTDMGDGVWVDVAWCMYTNQQVAQTFVLSGGGVGAINNAFQQSRQAGAVPNPQANGSNAMALAGRIRFVGRTVLTGGSSHAAGAFAGVTATITVKVLGLN